MDMSEFELDKRIDPEALDTECLRQPELFFKYAERAIEARGEADRLKLKLDLIQAELEIKVRHKPAKYSIEKPTEAAIKATVALQPEIAEANDNYFSARDDAALLDKAVVAMEIKKRMIESLITLHGQSYFAGPATPRNLKAAWLAQQEANTKRVTTRQVIKVGRKRGQNADSG